MKKILLITVCLAMFMGAAQAALSVRMDDSAVLVTSEGLQLTESGAYEDIVPLGGGLFAAREAGAKGYALMDEGAALHTGADYETLLVRNGVVLAEKDGLWGLLDAQGRALGAFSYTKLIPSQDGFWALKTDPNDSQSDRLWLLGCDGRERITQLRVRSLGKGGALLALQEAGSGLWGYCDSDGGMQLEARWDYAGTFSTGCAPVVMDEKYGVIDERGGWVIVPQFDFVEISPAGFILAGMNRVGVWVFGLDGGVLAAFAGEELNAYSVGDGFAVSDGRRVRLYDSSARPVLEAGEGASVYAGLNESFIISDGAWGEACVRLHDVPDAAWQNLYPLGVMEGTAAYAYMQVSAARYINDQLGEVQVSADMDTARYGVVDAAGAVCIPAEYESIEFLGEGRILARAGDEWRLMDLDGRVYWSHPITKTSQASS